MKILNIIRIGLIALIFAGTALTTFADAPPPPPPDPGFNGSNGPVGGDASLEGGVFLLVVMGMAYGGKKVYDARKCMDKQL